MKRPTPEWLRNAIFYQLYPQSFYDSNGDGIGDLPGITAKLDYIKSLGCDAVWLNPCFVSPFGDAGYDVADYYRVAPRYGTNADLRRLFKAAAAKGIKICLDLVPGHTSTEHPWFKQSCQARKNPYTNRYIWTDSVWEGAGTTFSAINGYAERDGNYITNFFWFQPALNFGFAQPDPAKPWQLPTSHPDCRAMKAEMMKIMHFWLDLGAAGFRVDMASSLVKGDTDGKAMHAFWQEVREWLDRDYPEAAIIAEWSFPKLAVTAGYHVDFMVHFGTPAYNALFRREPGRNIFPGAEKIPSFFDRSGKGDATLFLKHYLEHYAATQDLGYIALPTGNHDISRLNYDRTPAELKVCMAFLMTMPGVPFIYYGDEIGMRHIDGLVSKEGGYSRTGARTPMQWDNRRNAGFSTAPAAKLYLPIDPEPGRPTVADQEQDPASLLHFVRKMTALRRAHPALGNDGKFTSLVATAGKSPLVYLRSAGKEKIVVAVNPAAKPAVAEFAIKASGKNVVDLLPAGASLKSANGKFSLRLPACSWGIFQIA